MIKQVIRFGPALVLLLSAAVASAQEKDRNEVKGPPLDPKTVEEVKKSLDTLLNNKSVSDLAEAGRKLGNELLAGLAFDRRIAQLETREGLLEEQRVHALALVQDIQKERKETREMLDKDRASIREQYKADEKLADAEEAAIIEIYLPKLEKLKSQEAGLVKVVADATGHLVRVRSELRALKRQKPLVERGIGDPTFLTPPPMIDWGDEEDKPTPQSPRRNLKELQDRLKDL